MRPGSPGANLERRWIVSRFQRHATVRLPLLNQGRSAVARGSVGIDCVSESKVALDFDGSIGRMVSKLSAVVLFIDKTGFRASLPISKYTLALS